MLAGQTYRYTMPSSFEAVGPLRDWFRVLADKHGVGKNEAEDVEIALSEACNNVIEHGYHLEPQHRVDIEVTFTDGLLQTVVMDQAAPYEWHPAAPEPESLESERHRGQFLITQLMDTVQCRQHGQCGTELVMQKKWGSES